MFTNSKLAKSVKLACAFGAASSIGFTGAVNAQETEEAADAVEKNRSNRFSYPSYRH